MDIVLTPDARADVAQLVVAYVASLRAVGAKKRVSPRSTDEDVPEPVASVAGTTLLGGTVIDLRIPRHYCCANERSRLPLMIMEWLPGEQLLGKRETVGDRPVEAGRHHDVGAGERIADQMLARPEARQRPADLLVEAGEGRIHRRGRFAIEIRKVTVLAYHLQGMRIELHEDERQPLVVARPFDGCAAI